MKIINLVLKGKWYDMIDSGIKKEEYREIKSYWNKRFGELVHKDLDEYYVKFRHGYQSDARTMMFRLTNITIGNGNSEWGGTPDGHYFNLHLGERINNK